MHLKGSLKQAGFRTLRWALRRHVAAPPPRAQDPEDGVRVTILLAAAWGMGGTIRATLNYAGYLAQRHPVEIISVVRRRDEPFFAFPAGVRVTTLDDDRPGAARRPRRTVERLLRGVPSVLVDRHDRLYPDASLLTDIRLVRRLRGRTGVLIGTRPGLNVAIATLAPPALVTVGQEQMNLRAHRSELRRAIRRSYPRLDALVVLTEQDRARYERMLGGRVRLFRIPNTVRPNVGPTAALEGTTVLAAGRLSPQKGFDLLIKAFARVAPEHPDWRLRICGSGPAQEQLERLIERLGVGDVVSLPGPVEPLADEMERAAMFVLSSRFEGFPLVLLEAMAKGLAVAAFRCPTGPAEVIDDHRNGLLVPPKRVKALARAMAELMDDPALRRRLGAVAAETAKAYTMEAVGPQWEALLADLRGVTR